MAAFSKLVTAKHSALGAAAVFVLFALSRRRGRGTLHSKNDGKLSLQNEKEGKKEKAVVDSVFFARIWRILKIMVPGMFSQESAYLILIAVMLVARTYCDVWMIQNGTMIESAIIGRSTRDFKRYLFNFVAAMPAISLVNNFLKFGLNQLKLRFRIRLTTYLYGEYLKGYTYYKMGNLDNRIANADQLLTQDVEKFCNSVVDLYSNLSKQHIFIVLQRPYMTLGTLRDQVIYPDALEDQRQKGISDQVLKEYLDNVQLGHILEREGGWDCIQDWMDVLSGGEKQRMAMARLFYHKPQFAILDECTSAVSVDVEGYIYSHCRKVGITLFTVSHRKSLWTHHEYYLHMDGRGNYEFKPITADTVEFGS
ncbi:ATP-binding cassette sub-family D member 3a [Rhincodon typus]|uniref:ATP-binding cassette sub-family D member 3a n=1 Tax=Rhincodon typus TaxID=259920 RepID=UPI00202E3E44|nr:ATP-binding cassette sub-family D member 3a [Rhincodon typus]